MLQGFERGNGTIGRTCRRRHLERVVWCGLFVCWVDLGIVLGGVLGMSWNANISPKDIAGNAIAEGWYRVAQGGQVRVGRVIESEDTTLLVSFGTDRPQRVDELSQFCIWTLAEESEIREANGASRGA